MRVSVGAVLLAAVTAGCSGSDGAAETVTPVVTVTRTATETLLATETVTATVGPASAAVPETSDTRSMTPERVSLRVFEDGCGVVRGDVEPGSFDNLTWVVRDQDGFQVLGRNALNETRYRYFVPGTYTVTLEAWGGESYVPVSRTVTIRC